MSFAASSSVLGFTCSSALAKQASGKDSLEARPQARSQARPKALPDLSVHFFVAEGVPFRNDGFVCADTQERPAGRWPKWRRNGAPLQAMESGVARPAVSLAKVREGGRSARKRA